MKQIKIRGLNVAISIFRTRYFFDTRNDLLKCRFEVEDYSFYSILKSIISLEYMKQRRTIV